MSLITASMIVPVQNSTVMGYFELVVKCYYDVVIGSLAAVDLVHVGVVLFEVDLHVVGSVRSPAVLPVAWPSRTPLFALRMAVL